MVGIRSFPFGEAYFQGRTVSFREGMFLKKTHLLWVFKPSSTCSPKKMTSSSDLCGAYPIGSMGLVCIHRISPTLILWNQPTGGKYTSSMDPYGYFKILMFTFHRSFCGCFVTRDPVQQKDLEINRRKLWLIKLLLMVQKSQTTTWDV